MSLIKPLMSKKMRQRVVAIGRKEDAFPILTEVVGGKECIPVNRCGLEGALEADIIFRTWTKECLSVFFGCVNLVYVYEKGSLEELSRSVTELHLLTRIRHR